MTIRAQELMKEYYNKLGPGPYYYDNSAVAAALRYVTSQSTFADVRVNRTEEVVLVSDILKIVEELEQLK